MSSSREFMMQSTDKETAVMHHERQSLTREHFQWKKNGNIKPLNKYFYDSMGMYHTGMS